MSAPPMPSLPFSLIDFGNLVALALNTDLPDRFAESLLDCDPEHSSEPGRPRVHNPTTPGNKKSSLLQLWSFHLPKMRSTATAVSDSSSAWTDSTPSRPRLILDKIKHKASAFVLRTPQTTKPTATPSHISHISFFEQDELISTPQARKSQVGVFSRPASLVTAPPLSPTKSNKSIRSFSTTSSAAPATPTTDLYVPRSSGCSPDAPFNASRWSICTDESTTSSFCYPSHPFASTQDVTAQDPFAKGHVQVVRHSSGSHDLSLASYVPPRSPKRRSHHSDRKAQRRSSITAPALVPAPSCPLPTPPPSRQKEKVLRIRVPPATAFSGPGSPCAKTPDWTLSLPAHVEPPRSPKSPTLPSSSSSASSASSSSSLLSPEVMASLPPPPRKRTKGIIHRSNSFLSHSSSDESLTSQHAYASQCPSAWHPSPPPSPKRRVHHHLPHPPRTADSTASTESNDSTATIRPPSQLSQLQHRLQHERACALAALNGSSFPSPPRSPALTVFHRREAPAQAQEDEYENDNFDTASERSADSGAYYTARSSFASAFRAQQARSNFASAYGCSVRVRVDSNVRPAP